jgi:ABC-type phosphate transport system substrate-binding protein
MRPVDKFSLAFVIALVLGACAPQATPVPTPQAAYLGSTPAYAQWVEGWVQRYWQEAPGNGVTPLVYPLKTGIKAADVGEIELLISASQPPEGWFATPLLNDAIAILVHPDLKIETLDLDQLYEIFVGRVENWSELEGDDQVILPIISLPSDEIRTTFQAQVLQGANFTSNAQLAPHPAAALELVDSKPGAIALIPWSAVPAGRDSLRIETVAPSAASIRSGRYPLTLDLLAIAPSEPNGAMRQFLGWLQATLATGT